MGRNGGCCESIFKFFLIFINVLFFILGLVVFIMAALLKWSSVFNKFTNIKGIQSLINIGSISSISIALLVLGAFIILLSLFGLLGTCKEVKFMLKIYMVVVLILFLAMAIALLVLVFTSSKIEKSYKTAIEGLVNDINADFDQDKCNVMLALSEIFHCCGANGPADFNTTLTKTCCDKEQMYKPGCAQKSIDEIKKNAIHYLIVPSSIILGLELFTLITVPFLIGRFGKN